MSSVSWCPGLFWKVPDYPLWCPRCPRCPGVPGCSGRFLGIRYGVPNAPFLFLKQESSGESIVLIRNPNSPLDSCFIKREGALGTAGGYLGTFGRQGGHRDIGTSRTPARNLWNTGRTSGHQDTEDIRTQARNLWNTWRTSGHRGHQDTS